MAGEWQPKALQRDKKSDEISIDAKTVKILIRQNVFERQPTTAAMDKVCRVKWTLSRWNRVELISTMLYYFEATTLKPFAALQALRNIGDALFVVCTIVRYCVNVVLNVGMALPATGTTCRSSSGAESFWRCVFQKMQAFSDSIMCF